MLKIHRYLPYDGVQCVDHHGNRAELALVTALTAFDTDFWETTDAHSLDVCVYVLPIVICQKHYLFGMHTPFYLNSS